jgi:hypothetical protein
MSTVRPISEKQLEANRRNASQSTGPTTEAGKQASRMNAVKHGLLAKEVVITRGDYKEDERAFARLLEELRAQFQPVGVAEELEVQKIALCYWRKRRAVRYEHGAIRQRTGGMRKRQELNYENRFEAAARRGASLERTSYGIEYLIAYLEWVKQELRDGPVSDESQEWLKQHFPGKFALPDKTPYEIRLAEKTAAGRGVSENAPRQLADMVEEQLRRLSQLWEQVAATEKLNLDSKLRAAALPGPEAVDKLTRYETSNDRELDRILKRLEQMQERRRTNGGTPSEH